MLNKGKRHLPELAVFGGIFLLQTVLFFLLTQMLTTDSYEYIAADGFSWLGGLPHRYRLPLYPMLIDISNGIFGARGTLMVCAGQYVLYLVACVALYDALRRIAPRKGINLTITALYALAPSVLYWQRTILTESLSLSLSVFVLWALVCFLKDSRARYLLLCVVALVLGCLLRAVFALYAGMVFGFLLLRIVFPKKAEKPERHKQRVRDAKLLPIAAVPIVLLLCYASMFYAQYGAFTLSDSGTAQQLAIVLQEGYYTDGSDTELRELATDFMTKKTASSVRNAIYTQVYNEYAELELSEEELGALVSERLAAIDPEILLNEDYVTELDAYFASLYHNKWRTDSYPPMYRARCYIMEHFNHERINAFVDECKQANKTAYSEFLLHATYMRFYSFNQWKDGPTSVKTYYFLNTILPQQGFSLLLGIFSGIAELVIFLFLLLRKKRLSWLHLGLAGFILSTGILAIFGTNADFSRTAQTMLPFVYVAAALWIHAGADRLVKTEKVPCGCVL